MLVAGSAVFISACALFISLQEVHIMRTQQKAIMYPFLTTGLTYSSEGFGFKLKNSGNGLAKVNSYQVFNDSIYFNSWFEAIEFYMPEATEINYGIVNTVGNIRDEMITPRDQVYLFFLKWTPETRILEKRVKGLQVRICYSSLLGDHWLLENGVPTEIEKPCKIDMNKEFDR